MTISGVRLYSYRLPLVAPLTFLNTPIEFREGYLLQIEDAGGNLGYGECAPLIGYSSESLEQAGSELVRVARHLRNTEIDELNPLLTAQSVTEDEISSSVRFAVESAFVTLVAAKSGQPVATVFNEDFALDVFVNALLETTDNATASIARLNSSGCRAVKVKVGRRSVEDDLEYVRSIRAQLSHEISLRLDANQRWTFDQASRFAEGIAGCEIEYVEEPLRDPAELSHFACQYPRFPVALDETVRDLTDQSIADLAWCRAVVIKPTVIGGLERSLEVIRACKLSGKDAVLGAAIESSVGLTMIANLAASTLDETPIGLDTGRLFARDLVEPRLNISDYRVEIEPGGPARFEFNRDLMQEVPLG